VAPRVVLSHEGLDRCEIVDPHQRDEENLVIQVSQLIGGSWAAEARTPQARQCSLRVDTVLLVSAVCGLRHGPRHWPSRF